MQEMPRVPITSRYAKEEDWENRSRIIVGQGIAYILGKDATIW